MIIRTRLLLVLVTLLVCSLVVAGCTSVNANKDQKIVTPTTSANNDQTFIETVQSAGADLNPIIDGLGPAMSAKDYLTVQTLGTKLSTRAQLWYNKISPMPVSSQYQDQKSAFLQALLNKKATGDEWTIEAQNSGKVTTASPTYQSTYQQTVAMQTTYQSANDDQKFLDAYQNTIQDLSSTDLMTAMNVNDYETIKTISTKRSTRAQFWYDKISPMPVSSQYQESKNAFLLFLSESIAHYNGITKGTQLYQDGKWTESTAVMREAEEHTDKLIKYLNLAREKLPMSQGANDNQKVVYQQTVAVQTNLQSANDDQKFVDAYISSLQEFIPIVTTIDTELGSYHYPTVKTLGSKLSTRTQFWYDKISPMQVSSKCQDSKDTYLLYLSELKAYGDGWAEAMQFFQDGKASAFTSKLDEVKQHLKNSLVYLDLAKSELPV